MQSMAEHYLQQGETRSKREVILKLVQLRFHNVPEPLVETIRRLDDRNQLETLFEKAVMTQSLEELLTEVDALAEGENHNETLRIIVLSHIINDPNDWFSDPRNIVLVTVCIIHVSVESACIIDNLPLSQSLIKQFIYPNTKI